MIDFRKFGNYMINALLGPFCQFLLILMQSETNSDCHQVSIKINISRKSDEFERNILLLRNQLKNDPHFSKWDTLKIEDSSSAIIVAFILENAPWWNIQIKRKTTFLQPLTIIALSQQIQQFEPIFLHSWYAFVYSWYACVHYWYALCILDMLVCIHTF